MKPIAFSLLTALLASTHAWGMTRLDALSQIESRNNDHAIGAQQEVSRYQILPAFWAQANVVWRPTDAATAQVVVEWIMQTRCRAFQARYHHAPSDFQYYILWHRPACYLGRPHRRPLTTTEIDRARRFATLCQSN